MCQFSNNNNNNNKNNNKKILKIIMIILLIADTYEIIWLRLERIIIVTIWKNC